MAMNKLTGKVAIVTGSSSGIGAAIAIEMSRQGAQVTVHGRDSDKLKAVAKQCEEISPEKKKVCIVTGDLVDPDLRKKLIDQTLKCFGKLDIVVNNAGTVKISGIEDTSMESLDSMLDIHVRAPYHLTKLAIPELIKNKGSVLNISSVTSHRPVVNGVFMEYGMAKAALDQFTLWMARELGLKGVRVNSINPGVVITNICRILELDEIQMQQRFETFNSVHALGRIGQPEEIAKVAAFLASDDASFVTGLIMRVDGGFDTMPTGPRVPAM